MEILNQLPLPPKTPNKPTKKNTRKKKKKNPNQTGNAEVLLNEERLSLTFAESKMHSACETISWLSNK